MVVFCRFFIFSYFVGWSKLVNSLTHATTQIRCGFTWEGQRNQVVTVPMNGLFDMRIIVTV